jgi:hypothetical protein
MDDQEYMAYAEQWLTTLEEISAEVNALSNGEASYEEIVEIHVRATKHLDEILRLEQAKNLHPLARRAKGVVEQTLKNVQSRLHS